MSSKKHTPSDVKEARTGSAFYRISAISCAISFGFLAASLQCLHRSEAGFSFSASPTTAIAFCLGAALSTAYWKLVLQSNKSRRLATALMVLAGIVMFLYPLRFIPAEKLPDMSLGLLFAIIALSGVAALLLMMRRFLDSDKANESEATLPADSKEIEPAKRPK